MIPLSVPDLRGREAEYLAACVRDNWVSSAGPFIVEFEQRISELVGQPHAVATVNGTAALELALVASGVQRGDLVIVPDWTFAATCNAVYHAGATPIFVDITAESWTLDPELVEQALENGADRRISAVIAVDALGHPAQFDELADVCARYGATLIEDAAGAIGARYKGRPAGGLAEVATFSFNGNKTLTTGGGGMILTANAEIARIAHQLSTQARCGESYTHDAIGFNYRMTNVNAAIGLGQLERLDDMVARKREIAASYDTKLRGRTDLTSMPRAGWADHNCWLYSVLCADDSAASSLISHMKSRGIETRGFWRSLSAQEPYVDAPTLLKKVSRSITGRVVSLPCSSSLTEDDQSQVLDALADWRNES
jgi:perosamine synthetase